jgi:hypothetical protein
MFWYVFLYVFFLWPSYCENSEWPFLSLNVMAFLSLSIFWWSAMKITKTKISVILGGLCQRLFLGHRNLQCQLTCLSLVSTSSETLLCSVSPECWPALYSPSFQGPGWPFDRRSARSAMLCRRPVLCHSCVVWPYVTVMLFDLMSQLCCLTLCHSYVVWPYVAVMLSDLMSPLCCLTLCHRYVVWPCVTGVLSELKSHVCCLTLCHSYDSVLIHTVKANYRKPGTRSYADSRETSHRKVCSDFL